MRNWVGLVEGPTMILTVGVSLRWVLEEGQLLIGRVVPGGDLWRYRRDIFGEDASRIRGMTSRR